MHTPACPHGKAGRHLCRYCLAHDNIKPEYLPLAYRTDEAMHDTSLDALEFLLNAPPLPDGCTCTRGLTETIGLLQLVWNEDCPVHGTDDTHTTTEGRSDAS